MGYVAMDVTSPPQRHANAFVRRDFGFPINLQIVILRVIDDECGRFIVREEVLLAVDHVHYRHPSVQRDRRVRQGLAHQGETTR